MSVPEGAVIVGPGGTAPGVILDGGLTTGGVLANGAFVGGGAVTAGGLQVDQFGNILSTGLGGFGSANTGVFVD